MPFTPPIPCESPAACTAAGRCLYLGADPARGCIAAAAAARRTLPYTAVGLNVMQGHLRRASAESHSLAKRIARLLNLIPGAQVPPNR